MISRPAIRVAVALAIAECLALVLLSLVQFQKANSLGRNVDPVSDPFVSALSWAEILLVIVLPPAIGVLVGVARGRALVAGGLAAGSVSLAMVVTPLVEQLVSPDAGYVVLPAGGSGSGGGLVPYLVVIGILVGGGFAALEASLATLMARRLSRTG